MVDEDYTVMGIPKKQKEDAKSAGKGKEQKAEAGSKPGQKIPVVNIGLVGHVDHGKTSLTAAITGKWTDTHSEEIKRGITIRLGYADVSFYECPKCKGHSRFGTSGRCINCFSECRYLRTISFVDAPGHETLMTTVLSGTALMDGALLIIAANEQCPQPQTREHLTTLDITGIRRIVVVQNKIDLVSEKDAMENYRQIRAFLKGSVAENAPIIPVSALNRINISALVEAIEKNIPTPERDPKKTPLLYIARSFDVNRPGTPITELKGAVLGGSLVQGELAVGDKIEISPGLNREGVFTPVTTTITGLQKAGLNLDRTGPGGLLGVSTTLDPAVGKSDGLSGNVAGRPGTLPQSTTEVTFRPHLLERVIGSKENLKVEGFRPGEVIMLAVGVSRTVGAVAATSGEKVQIKCKMPVVAKKGDRLAISRQISGRWRLIGWGEAL